jgi:hypothetical protein
MATNGHFAAIGVDNDKTAYEHGVQVIDENKEFRGLGCLIIAHEPARESLVILESIRPFFLFPLHGYLHHLQSLILQATLLVITTRHGLRILTIPQPLLSGLWYSVAPS